MNSHAEEDQNCWIHHSTAIELRPPGMPSGAPLTLSMPFAVRSAKRQKGLELAEALLSIPERGKANSL
jgi:hypothetical protein